MSTPAYNLISGDRKYGPYTRHQLAAMLADGEIDLDSLCIRVGDGEIQHIHELFEKPGAPPSRRPVLTPRPAPASVMEEIAGDESTDRSGRATDSDRENDDPDEEEEEAEEEPASDEPLERVPPPRERDPDEIICSLHPSILGYPKLLVTALALGALAGASHLLGPQLDFAPSFVDTPLGLAAAASFALLLVLRHFDNYYVTRTRAEVVRGIIARSSNEVRISDVRRIDVDKKGWLGLLNVGDVKLSSAGTGGFDVVFRHVRGGHRVKKILRRIQKNPTAPRRQLAGKTWI